MTAPAVVAIGGGHGLAASLAALRRTTSSIAAVVAVADDGGSTGRLRDAVDLPALGDLRKALVALSSPDSTLAAAMHHRFGAGDIIGHAFGNLLIAALAETGHDLPEALAEIGRLTDSIGVVYPSSVEPVVLRALTRDGIEVIGQVRIMRTKGIDRVTLVPSRPAAPPAALDAIRGADLVVIGPGSLFTSVLAATAVPAVLEAINVSNGRVVYVCNLHPQPGETEGYDLGDHLDALARHGVVPDVVLYDPDSIGDSGADSRCEAWQLAVPGRPVHDPERLAKALEAQR